MSLDKSLKSRDSLVRHRNVLTRSERLDKLEEDELWSEGASVFGLPKVLHRKASLAKKDKEKSDESVDTTVVGTEDTSAKDVESKAGD